MNDDAVWMRRALELAENGRYSVNPNPMVGCVIVNDGTLVGEGYHLRTGLPHAEIEALRKAGPKASGGTVFVTLEPCSHFGRTPPCVDSLLEAHVSRVVVAATDPNRMVNGRGIRRLREAGIEVDVGLMGEEAERLNEKFLFSARNGRPFVLLKAGMTLDAKMATISRESQWITSPEARERGLLLREEYDAILVGSGTVVSDNPHLTRRLGRSSSITPWTRVVVDAEGAIPLSSHVLSDAERTLLFTAFPDRYSRTVNTEIIGMPAQDNKLDLFSVLTELHRRGISSVIAEGGSALHSDLIARRLWQKMILFVAPMIVGGSQAPSIFGGEGVSHLTDAHRFRFDAVERIGTDVMLTAYAE